MKEFNEILKDNRIIKTFKKIETEEVSKLKMEVRSSKQSDKALVSLSKIMGWEHLSVSFKNKIPSWECMQEMKELCFRDDEECFQIHPKVDDYVNNNEYTLHIWRPVEGMKQIPPHILVGFRPNHLEEDAALAKKLHEDLNMPLSEEELEWLILSATPEGREKLSKEMQNNPMTLFKLSSKMGII